MCDYAGAIVAKLMIVCDRPQADKAWSKLKSGDGGMERNYTPHQQSTTVSDRWCLEPYQREGKVHDSYTTTRSFCSAEDIQLSGGLFLS